MQIKVPEEHRWHKMGALLAFVVAVAILPTSQYFLKLGQDQHREQGEVAGVSTLQNVSTSPCEQERQAQLANLAEATNQAKKHLLDQYRRAVEPYELAKPVLVGSAEAIAQERAALDQLIASEYQQYQGFLDKVNLQDETERQSILQKPCD